MQTTDDGGNSYGTSSEGVSSQVHKLIYYFKAKPKSRFHSLFLLSSK